jgi:hypothetical protein
MNMCLTYTALFIMAGNNLCVQSCPLRFVFIMFEDMLLLIMPHLLQNSNVSCEFIAICALSQLKILSHTLMA